MVIANNVKNNKAMGRVLVIAGSDSGGGAGIQADIKAITRMGAYASTAITAITVQNTLGVSNIHPVPATIVTEQIQAVLDDIGADVIKTGMLLNNAIIQATIEAVTRYPSPLILDPVMVSTSGSALLENSAITLLKEQLLPKSFLITPNIPEAQLLTGLAHINSQETMIEAGRKLQSMGAKNVLIKGGHLPEQADIIYDILLTPNDTYIFESKRIATRHTHGTGCTLASAIAANLANGKSLSDAVMIARSYVYEAIRTAPELGKGKGPLNHMAA